MLQARLAQMLKTGHEVLRVVWFDADGKLLAMRGLDLPAAGLTESSREAAAMSRTTRSGRYSDPYGATGLMHGLIDFHLPLYRGRSYVGSLVATYNLQVLLDENVPWWFAQDNALSLLDRDDGVIARAPPAVPDAASTPTSARSTCPAPRSCWPPTASRARPSCCRTCWSAR
jgi:two-component system sensor histidine kinase DctS